MYVWIYIVHVLSVPYALTHLYTCIYIHVHVPFHAPPLTRLSSKQLSAVYHDDHKDGILRGIIISYMFMFMYRGRCASYNVTLLCSDADGTVQDLPQLLCGGGSSHCREVHVHVYTYTHCTHT